LKGRSDRQKSVDYLSLTWEISCGSIERKMIHGPEKKLKGGEHKRKSVRSKKSVSSGADGGSRT